MLVYGAVLPCLPAIVIEKLHGTPKDVGFLFGSFGNINNYSITTYNLNRSIQIALGYLVATPAFAIISDRYQNRRYPMMFGTFCIFLSTLCFAWANTFKLLVMARICQGASAGASW
jgi:MFS family permease